jgi:glycosyltransferase involved in cell wall biosynthesis
VLKISFTGAPEWMDRNVGYGEASWHIFEEFKKQDIQALVKSKEANIGISFIQPNKYTFTKDQYKIGYTPWESTGIFPSWKNPLNNVIDELWTTSEWCADMFSKHTNKPIFVYEHGIQDDWIPKKRELNPSRPFRFLHVGEPFSRKDAQMVVDAFVSLFGDNPNFELILKCTGMNTTRIFDKVDGHVIGSPGAVYPNIRTIESMLSVEQINGLYDLCDVFVYPSWGEGFGFNTLQALAKSLPAISTYEWAPYKKYITAPVSSTYVPSPWPHIHPGNMMKPDYSELKFYMQDVYENYEKYSDIAYTNSFLVHKDYNWQKVTKPAAKRLKEIQKANF